MSTENHSPQHEDGAGESPWPAPDSEERQKLEKGLAQLRDQGILIGGHGPRETLRPVAHVPGALERFLKARG